MARARPTPYVVGAPENDADDDDEDGVDEDGDEGPHGDFEGPEAGSVEDISARWDAAMAADDDDPPAIAFVGRPNVGKSSLLNALLGEERSIVSAIPGTTRDAIDTTIAWGRSEIVLIDTAGIRRRGKVASGPAAEKYSTMRALKAISRADVAVLVLDAADGLTAQDAHVAGYVIEEGKGLIIAVNKWDIVEDKTHKSFDDLVVTLRRELKFIDYAPIVSISAKTGQRVQKILELAVDVWGERRKRVGTGELNRLVATAVERTPPAVVHGRRAKIRYVTQAGVAPPTFVFFVTDPASIHFSYRRFLENRLREAYGFDGTPIRLIFREQTREKRERKGRTRHNRPQTRS
jgi:GTP-binding protein